ncbi:basic proline-rich protein-like [Amphibalanus amphitrite]|uniref:basic proline-rich protein-like n=1 Tax=Amphibalanus amphitrite TaxID=1232801 RepID=UPI001C903C2B|nr:basic proline-rich protein-like [Amphibalanus amphitrite]
MKAVGEKKCENGNETGDDEVGVLEKPQRPIHRRRKLREPLYEEDIIDGFAIASFKTYSDLERAVRQAERRGLKTLEPLPPPGSTPATVRRRRKSSDGRTQGGGHSSGDGYFCDHSASDDGKVSDSGSVIFSSAGKRECPTPNSVSLVKRESPPPPPSTSANGALVTSPHTTAGTTCVTAPAASRSLPAHQVTIVPRCTAPPSRGFLPHPGLATYPAPSAALRATGGDPTGRPPPPRTAPDTVPPPAAAATAASPVPGRARFAVRDLVSPSAAAAPVAAAGPPPPGRNNGCSPAPASLPTAPAASRAKPPRHKTSSGSPASASSRRQSPALDRQHPYSVAGLSRLPGPAGAAAGPAPQRTPPAAAVRSPMSMGVFAPPPPPPLLAGAGGLGLPPAAPAPPPPPLPGHDAANKADLLRRELDTRFLASQDHSISVGPPPYLRPTSAELHQQSHQHQHHQHHPAPPPALLKSVPKLGSVNSPFFPTGSAPSMATMSPLSARPPAPSFLPGAPLQLTAPKKTGRWNAMHVRIAWEIYKNQQKSPASACGPERGSAGPVGPRPVEPPLLPGPGTHLRPSLIDVTGAPHPLAPAGFPRYPSLAPPVSGAFSGLLPPPPPPGAFLDRHGPAPPAGGHPFAALDSWSRLARPPVPTSSWPSLKPEPPPAAPGRPPYSPALEERDRRPSSAERRRTAATPPRRDHSRSPIRLKAEPPEPRRDHEERPRSADHKGAAAAAAAAARHINGVLQSRELERLARDRQLLDHKLLWGLHAPAAPPYGMRPPPPPPHDSLHLVNSFKSPYPGAVPGLGPPLGPLAGLAGCSSMPLRRLEPPPAPGAPPLPGLPRRDADPGR